MTGQPDRRRLRLGGSLRFRVTALAAVAVLAVLTAAGIGIVLVHRAGLTVSVDEGMGDRADVIAGQLRSGQPVQRQDLPTDDVVVQVLDPGGSVVVESRGLTGTRLSALVPAGTTIRNGEMPGGGPARVLARSVDGATVYVAASLEDVRASTGILLRTLLVAVPASTVVLAGLVWWLVGRVLRPVDAIRSEVDRISASRLDRRVPEPPTADEIARLARTMNEMLDRLAGSAERQRRFAADAAHELRSPLARIRAALEVDAAHPSTADLAGTHASVLAQAVVLQRLVEDLLLLARGDSGALRQGRVGPVDLDEVVLDVLRERADSRVDASGVAPVQVPGDPEQLHRAVRNLVDNAVRHARNRIEVTLTPCADDAVLMVSDDGPGVAAEHAERVFERFTRLDDARVAAEGGVGLGLAIARDIAERHGGTLVVSADGPPGARFVLRMPLIGAAGRSEQPGDLPVPRVGHRWEG